MARYGSVRRGSGVRRFASPSPMARPGRVARYGAPVALCRALSRAGGSLGCSAMFRLTGSRGPGRLSSGTAAGSAALASHCFALGGIFFREPGRLPGAGARIRAGKGSVRAPGVPLTAAYCPGASGALWRGCCPSCIVPLSHRKVWGIAIGLPGGAAGVTSRTSGIRRSGAGCQVTGRTRAITRAGEGPSRGDIVPAVRSCHRIHLSRQG